MLFKDAVDLKTFTGADTDGLMLLDIVFILFMVVIGSCTFSVEDNLTSINFELALSKSLDV